MAIIIKKIAVIAGTSEATEVIKNISTKYDVTAFVATTLGKAILKDCKCNILVGRLNIQKFIKCFSENRFNTIVDCSHPFAIEVSSNVKSVCELLKIPYIRVSRKSCDYNYDKIIHTDSKESAVEILNKISGNIFFTTGANTLQFYADNVENFKKRAIARVLDTDFSHTATKLLEDNVIYENPPFSIEDNLKVVKDFDISVMISKDSGERGGVWEKIECARCNNIPIVIIDSPEKSKNIIKPESVLSILDKL